MTENRLRFSLIAVVSALTIFVNGCDAIWLASAKERQNPNGQARVLKVAILNHPYSWNSDKSGFERDLIEKFAMDFGYQISWQIFKTRPEVLKAVQQKSADLAAARFDLRTADDRSVLVGPAYEETPQAIVCPKVKEEGVSFFKRLFTLRFGKHIPAGFQVVSDGNLSAFDLLKNINLDRTSCASIDNNEAKYLIRMFPRLDYIQEVSPSTSIGFLLSTDRSNVRDELLSWFQTSSRNHFIDSARDLYLSHLNELNSYDTSMLFKTVREELKDLEPKFRKVAREFKLPWTLVAAIAYQESHWDNDAESFTGVKGIMMLTQDTADLMGVEDRTDLDQSLWGGTKYFKRLLNELPPELTGRQRLVYALASYNVGPAHIDDAQDLAENYGGDRWSWRDLKKTLPLLSRPDFLHLLRYGEARGEEPITFANRVLNYYEILRAMEAYKKAQAEEKLAAAAAYRKKHRR